MLEAFDEVLGFVFKSDFPGAYERLLKIRPPTATDALVEFEIIRLFSHFLRGVKLLVEGDTSREPKQLIDRFVQELPEGTMLEPLRAVARASLLLMSKSPSKLTREQVKELETLGMDTAVRQARALKRAGDAFEEAIELFDENNNEIELDLKMALAKRHWDMGMAENESMRPVYTSIWSYFEFKIAFRRFVAAVSQFDFPSARQRHGEAIASIKRMNEAHGEQTIAGLTMWVPGVTASFSCMASCVRGVAEVLEKALRGGSFRGAETTLQAARADGIKAAAEVKNVLGHHDIAGDAQATILAASAFWVGVVDRLGRSLRPTRDQLVNVTGSIVALTFFAYWGAILAIAAYAGVALGPVLTVMVALFLAGLSGYGFGVLKFKGFFIDVLLGRSDP